MESINFKILENMTDYEDSIKGFSVEKLKEEYKKISQKIKLNYIYVDDSYFYIKELNIYDKPNEVFRVFNRKRVAFVSAFLSGCFKDCGLDYALAWSYVNNRFVESTYMPSYADCQIEGKQVSLADKLNYQGCVAYKNYLMLLYDYLSNKGYDFERSVNMAINDENYVDQKLDRSDFYSRYFLPKSINSVHKNILKLSILKSDIKEKEAIKELN